MGVLGQSNKINNFHERLDFSVKASHEEFWEAVYRKAFPDMESHMQCLKKCQGQYLGIDRVIQLTSGKTLYIDEKKRETEYDDILLEYISNDRTNSPGWIEKELLIDYLAYAFMKSKRVYIFPWLILRRVWKNFGEEWKLKYTLSPAKNNGYNTISVAVPTKELLNCIKNAMIIQL